MSIPTRAELIERARRFVADGKRDAFCYDDDMADFALSVLVAELEALRATRLLLPAINMNDQYALGRHDEELTWANAIYARLAALRSEQPKSEASMPLAGRGLERREPGSIPGAMSAGGDAGGNSGETKARAGAGAHGAEESAIDCTTDKAGGGSSDTAGSQPARAEQPPALSDAEILERAAEIVRAMVGEDADGPHPSVDTLTRLSSELRAASAPVPVPKPVDVFEAFQSWKLTCSPGVQLERAARDWFGPLVAALENAAEGECEDPPSLDNWTCSGCWPCEAKKIVAALRQRAQEASR